MALTDVLTNVVEDEFHVFGCIIVENGWKLKLLHLFLLRFLLELFIEFLTTFLQLSDETIDLNALGV